LRAFNTVPEIADFCEGTVRSDYRPRPAVPLEPQRPPPTADEKARVAAKAADVLASLARAMGRKNPHEQLSEAQRIVDRCEREAKEAAIAAVRARQSPPTDGAHAGRALADLETRRHSPFDDPDLE
jgi:hypothetical protein